MYRFPCASTATPSGSLSCAEVACPLSPVKPAVPVPAIVVIVSLPDTPIAAGATTAATTSPSIPIRIHDRIRPPSARPFGGITGRWQGQAA